MDKYFTLVAPTLRLTRQKVQIFMELISVKEKLYFTEVSRLIFNFRS